MISNNTEVFWVDDFSFKSDGTVDESPYGSIINYPDREAVSSDLRNEDFFPFAAWEQPASLSGWYSNMSVNVFVSGAVQSAVEFLDALNAQGIRGIVMPSETGKSVDQEKVQQLKTHQALLGWMFYSTPDNAIINSSGTFSGPSPGAVSAVREDVKAIDSAHSFFVDLGSSVSWIEACP